MVVPSGRYVPCAGCGRVIPEGCVRPAYCTYECQKKSREEREKKAEELRKAIEAEKERKAPSYQI